MLYIKTIAFLLDLCFSTQYYAQNLNEKGNKDTVYWDQDSNETSILITHQAGVQFIKFIRLEYFASKQRETHSSEIMFIILSWGLHEDK